MASVSIGDIAKLAPSATVRTTSPPHLYISLSIKAVRHHIILDREKQHTCMQ